MTHYDDSKTTRSASTQFAGATQTGVQLSGGGGGPGACLGVRSIAVARRFDGLGIFTSSRPTETSCVLNGLSVLEDALGDLDQIQRVIKVVGYVASAPGFSDQPAVIDAASGLLIDVFGELGRHARSAVGVAELPRGAPVEIELVVRCN